MVDTWVVGNFVSNEAFSAVGTVGPIVNMLIGCFLGFSSGAGVVISQYYGARRTERVHDAVHTALVLTVILCAVFTALGIGFTPLMLRLMNTPAEVFPESSAYLTIYFGGISGLLIYNMGSGILRAVGDSRRPFYFLVVSAVLNTALDLLFVLRFGMGVEGVAWATVIAQAISALLVIVVLLRTQQAVRLIPVTFASIFLCCGRSSGWASPPLCKWPSPPSPMSLSSPTSTPSAPTAWAAGRPIPRSTS